MPNKIQIKRTTTSGLLPNVSNSSNTSYIAAGELAINLTDRKLLSSNGSATFEIGANLASISVGGALTGNSTGLFVSSAAPQISLNNVTSNWITFSTNGVAAPTTTTRSAGTKLALYPSLNASQVDYAIGIESNHMWFSTDNATTGVKFYANTSNYMTANVAGLTVTGYANVSSTLAAGNTSITGFINVSSTAQFGSNVILGTTTISANGSVGTAGQILTSGGSGNVYWSTGGGGGSPGGANTQIQFNDGGSFGGDAGLTYNKTTDALTVAGALTVNGAVTVPNTAALGNTTVTGFANVTTTATIGTGFTLTSGNANFDSGVLFVDGTNNRVGVGNTTPGHALSVTGTTNLGGAVTGITTLAAGNTTITGNLSASNFSGSSSGTNTGDQTNISGNAGTATTLQTTRSINLVNFNGSANITIPRMNALDDRTIAPADGSAGYVTSFFTSWTNNNTSPYADALLFRTYGDSSGGNDNLVTFRKDAIGMRIWQQTYGSATAFSSFKDVAWTDGTNASGNWGINITGSAGSVDFNNLTNKGSGTGTYTTSGDFRAPIFYDSNNTAFYTDPASTSLLNVLRIGSSESGLYLSSSRLVVRSESADNVAQFAVYGMYLPVTGQTAGLYVESPIEARTGLRMGSSAANGTITVGADTAVTANRLVQRDGNGYIYANHINFNTSETENPTIGSFITSNGDGWSRKSSLAHVKNSIRGVADGSWGISITGNAAGATFSNDSATQDNITTRTDSGFYQSSTGTTAEGWPLNDGTWQHMISCTHANDGNYYAMQLGSGFYSQGLFYRATNGSGSTAWSRVALYNNSYDAALYASAYYDTNNTAFYVDPASSSVLSTIIARKNTAGSTPTDSASIVLSNRNTSINGGMMGGIFADTYRDVRDPHYSGGIWFTRNQTAGNLSSSSDIVFGAMDSWGDGLPTERMRIYSSGPVIASSDFRAPIYYDSNNTAYYLDAANAGASDALKLNGGIGFAIANPYLQSSSYFVIPGGAYFNSGTVYTEANIKARGGVGNDTAAALTLTGGTGGYTQINGSARSPIFYDSDNTGYLVDASGTSFLNVVGMNGNLDVYGNQYLRSSFLLLNTAGNDWNFVIDRNGGNNWIVYGGNSVRAPIFYDSNNTAYYLDAASTGTSLILGGLLQGGSSASTDVNGANDTGSFSVRGSSTTVAAMSFHRTGAYAMNMGLGTDNVFRIGGWSASNNCLQMDGSGNLTMLNNVTAYSDARLKKDIVKIDNALDKVQQLNGYTYTRTDTGSRQAGVIAQEVMKVLPEVVMGSEETNYSVAYGNMVGLLIEAIKEQQEQINRLEVKINSLQQGN